MAQLSLYLDDATMGEVQRRARLSDLSISKYVSSLIREKLDANWPTGFWNLYGSIDDSLECPDELPFALDGPRGEL